jgi:putative ABC transport system substrate-binding protein
VKRREFITLIGGMAAGWPLAARGQNRVWRLGALETTSQAMNSVNYSILREALRDLGYVEGQNLVIEYRSADGRDERFPQLAAELVSMKVDLILTRGTPATVAARNASGTIPIVMTSTADPFAVVGHIARPGGNVTGMASLLVDLTSKRLALLTEIVPGLARVGILSNLDNPNYAPPGELRDAARAGHAACCLSVTPEDSG